MTFDLDFDQFGPTLFLRTSVTSTQEHPKNIIPWSEFKCVGGRVLMDPWPRLKSEITKALCEMGMK